MISWNDLHKLADVIFGITEKPILLHHQIGHVMHH